MLTPVRAGAGAALDQRGVSPSGHQPRPPKSYERLIGRTRRSRIPSRRPVRVGCTSGYRHLRLLRSQKPSAERRFGPKRGPGELHRLGGSQANACSEGQGPASADVTWRRLAGRFTHSKRWWRQRAPLTTTSKRLPETTHRAGLHPAPKTSCPTATDSANNPPIPHRPCLATGRLNSSSHSAVRMLRRFAAGQGGRDARRRSLALALHQPRDRQHRHGGRRDGHGQSPWQRRPELTRDTATVRPLSR